MLKTDLTIKNSIFKRFRYFHSSSPCLMPIFDALAKAGLKGAPGLLDAAATNNPALRGAISQGVTKAVSGDNVSNAKVSPNDLKQDSIQEESKITIPYIPHPVLDQSGEIQTVDVKPSKILHISKSAPALTENVKHPNSPPPPDNPNKAKTAGNDEGGEKEPKKEEAPKDQESKITGLFLGITASIIGAIIYDQGKVSYEEAQNEWKLARANGSKDSFFQYFAKKFGNEVSKFVRWKEEKENNVVPEKPKRRSIWDPGSTVRQPGEKLELPRKNK